MKTVNFLFLFVILSIMIQCKSKLDESNWRGPNRDGVYPETNLLKQWPEEGPKMLWKFEDLGLGYTSASVTSNQVFTTGTIDSVSYIFAFNHEGNLLWKKEYGKAWMENFPGVRCTPVIRDRKGYVLSGLGKLVCFNIENGEEIWAKDLFKDFDGRKVFYGYSENLLIDGNKLICTPGGIVDNVIALDKDSGELIWKCEGVGEKSAYCSPQMISFEGKRYLITITEKSVLSIDPESGKLIWSYELQYPHGIHGNTPLFKDGYLFVMNGWNFGSEMLKINPGGENVEKVWYSDLFDLEHGDVVLVGENIYGTDYKTKHFSCVDMKTGDVKQAVKDLAPGTVIVADGMIYCYAYSGDMALIQPKENGFEIVSRFKAPGKKRDHLAHPVIKDGKLYLRYANGMYVYSISKV